MKRFSDSLYSKLRRRLADTPVLRIHSNRHTWRHQCHHPAHYREHLLAFGCLNLPSLMIPSHGDRTGDSAVVDLLFFPTGGGKTEAYLGLVAYTFAIRRLQGKIASDDGELGGAAGVAVFMRYTLRLLTSQQFQRAAALVCACEVMRRERLAAEPRWGDAISPRTLDRCIDDAELERRFLGCDQDGAPA